MTLSTAFTELVGCSVPIQSAGMGTSSPRLAAEVAAAGGLGMASGVLVTPAQLAQALDDIDPARGAVGVNFVVPFLAERESVSEAARRARVVEFFYADPDPELARLVHAGGALAAWQVGSVAEAVAAERAGCDLVVVQGVEAGGHVRGRVGLFPLLAQVLDVLRVPVVAAGGIASPRSVAAALSAGAGGVRVGTHFVAAVESGFHPDYKQALLEADGEDTVYTERFSVDWPDAPHRVLRSSLEAAESWPAELVGELTFAGETIPVPRFGVPSPIEGATGELAAMAHYAGQGVGSVVEVKRAAEIVRDLVEGAEVLLRSPAWRVERSA